MRVKNKPEPAGAKAAMHSLELSLRPLPHDVLGKRGVQRGRRIHALDDVDLMQSAMFTLAQMLGYDDLSAKTALIAEAINRVPMENQRRLVVQMLIDGNGLQLEKSEGMIMAGAIQRYQPLIPPANLNARPETIQLPTKVSSRLWTPDQGRP